MITFIQKNFDWLGASVSGVLVGMSFSELNQLAQAIAALSATAVAMVTIYYRVKQGDNKDDE